MSVLTTDTVNPWQLLYNSCNIFINHALFACLGRACLVPPTPLYIRGKAHSLAICHGGGQSVDISAAASYASHVVKDSRWPCELQEAQSSAEQRNITQEAETSCSAFMCGGLRLFFFTMAAAAAAAAELLTVRPVLSIFHYLISASQKKKKVLHGCVCVCKSEAVCLYVNTRRLIDDT